MKRSLTGATKESPSRPKCQACGRRPGRRILCPGCQRYVGPGCCWVETSGRCRECISVQPEPEPECAVVDREALCRVIWLVTLCGEISRTEAELQDPVNKEKEGFGLMIVFFIFGITCIVVGVLVGRWSKKTPPEKKKEVVLRTVMTQSQCTYQWYRSKPCFQASADVLTGAWPISLSVIQK